MDDQRRHAPEAPQVLPEVGRRKRLGRSQRLRSGVLGDLVGAREQRLRLLARFGQRRLSLSQSQLSIPRGGLRVLESLADACCPLIEDPQDRLEGKSIGEIQEQQRVDDLEDELRQIDAERVEEGH